MRVRDKEDICMLIKHFCKMRTSSLNIFNIWLRFLSRCFKEVSTPFIWRMWDMRYEIWDLRKVNEIWDMRNEISDICPLSPWRRRQLQDWAGTLRRGSWPRAGLPQGSPATAMFVLSNIVILHWYEILILSVSDIQCWLNYTKGIRHKKRETTKIMERCHFEMDKTQDREYQLDVARADIYIHSIHFLPVRWGEMRTPCRKRTSPAHSTRCFQ